MLIAGWMSALPPRGIQVAFLIFLLARMCGGCVPTASGKSRVMQQGCRPMGRIADAFVFRAASLSERFGRWPQ